MSTVKLEVPISFHRSLEEREQSIREEFKSSKSGTVLPACALSCGDGILILGLSRRPKVLKVRRILDRIAFVGVGMISDYESLYKL